MKPGEQASKQGGVEEELALGKPQIKWLFISRLGGQHFKVVTCRFKTGTTLEPEVIVTSAG